MVAHLKTFFTNKKSIAIGSGFFLLGFLFGNWATLLPYLKIAYQIDDGVLGLILLCFPLGAMSFNPFAALLIQKYGMQKMTVIGMCLTSIMYMLPLSSPYIIFIPISLVAIGMSVTVLNISMNTAAAAIEITEKINIISTCHGLFSVGLMIGAFMRSLTLMTGISETNHMYFMCLFGLGITLMYKNTILSIQSIEKTEAQVDQKFKFTFPKGGLLAIVIISACVNVTEGSMADWTSVYMTDVVHASPYFVGWGLLGYSCFMAIGRFFGDAIIPYFGKNNILKYGALLAIMGLLIAIFLPYTVTTVIGFAFVGLGVSCGAPILYASAARYPDIPNSGGLAIMNTFAMGGFLIGPAVIGFISDLTSLVVSFIFVALVCVIWFYKSQKVILY